MKLLLQCAPTLMLAAAITALASHAQADVSAKTVMRGDVARDLAATLPCEAAPPQSSR